MLIHGRSYGLAGLVLGVIGWSQRHAVSTHIYNEVMGIVITLVDCTPPCVPEYKEPSIAIDAGLRHLSGFTILVFLVAPDKDGPE